MKIIVLAESSRLLPTIASRLQVLPGDSIFATISERVAEKSKLETWQSGLAKLPVSTEKERKFVQELLYWYPAEHSGIKHSLITL